MGRHVERELLGMPAGVDSLGLPEIDGVWLPTDCPPVTSIALAQHRAAHLQGLGQDRLRLSVAALAAVDARQAVEASDGIGMALANAVGRNSALFARSSF
jgi:hypothetical protein